MPEENAHRIEADLSFKMGSGDELPRFSFSMLLPAGAVAMSDLDLRSYLVEKLTMAIRVLGRADRVPPELGVWAGSGAVRPAPLDILVHAIKRLAAD